MTTSTAVSSLRSVGAMPRRRLTAMSRRYTIDPPMTLNKTQLMLRTPKMHLAHDDPGKAGDDGADAHADVGEALLLRHQRATERYQRVRDAQPRRCG